MKMLFVLPLFVLLAACGGNPNRGPIIGSVFAPAPPVVTVYRPAPRPWWKPWKQRRYVAVHRRGRR
jgi:hypothetical protein